MQKNTGKTNFGKEAGRFLFYYLRSMRLYYGFVTGATVLLGLAAASVCFSKDPLPDWRGMTALILGFLAWGANQIFNDWGNLAEDRINAPERPMVTGKTRRLPGSRPFRGTDRWFRSHFSLSELADAPSADARCPAQSGVQLGERSSGRRLCRLLAFHHAVRSFRIPHRCGRLHFRLVCRRHFARRISEYPDFSGRSFPGLLTCSFPGLRVCRLFPVHSCCASRFPDALHDVPFQLL